MSRLVLNTILNEVLGSITFPIELQDIDKEQLYQEILYYFCLVGALNACETLEAAWQDPYNQTEIRDFILAWLRKKAKKAVKATGVI